MTMMRSRIELLDGTTMTAISARSQWLAHLRYCTRCPVNRCSHGDELAAAVREELAPGELWNGVYRPHRTEHGPARAARERQDPARLEAPG